MSRKRQASHADERWLLTYADMITLLMALFIVLFAISVVNQGKFEELSKSLKESFSGAVADGGESILNTGSPTFVADTNNSASDSSQDVVEEASEGLRNQQQQKLSTAKAKAALAQARVEQATLDKEIAAARERVTSVARELGLESKVQTEITERGLVIRLITDDVLFSTASSTLQSEGMPLLRGIATAIDPIPNPIHVEGHTDAQPFAGDRYGNWRLSSERAESVLFFLFDQGVDPDRHTKDVTATGYADKHPLPGVAPLDGRNRRVEIVVVRRDLVAEVEAEVTGPLGADPANAELTIPLPVDTTAGPLEGATDG